MNQKNTPKMKVYFFIQNVIVLQQNCNQNVIELTERIVYNISSIKG